MRIEIKGVVYTVKAKGRAKAVQRAAEQFFGRPVTTAPHFVGYTKGGVWYKVVCGDDVVDAMVYNEGAL